MPTRLQKIHIEGFRSIKSCDLKLANLNVLIGANGAGKSNLVSFFKMMNFLTTEALQEFIARSGFASSILRYGPKTTPQLELRLLFLSDKGEENTYYARLFHVASDTLAFAEESIVYAKSQAPKQQPRDYGSGHKESALKDREISGDKTAQVMRYFLSRCRVFQFHDTSPSALIRQHCRVNDNQSIRDSAGNLAAFLFRLQQQEREYYRRIVATIRQVVPFFKDFVLDPLALNPDFTSLRWLDLQSEYEFGPHQLSDGTLRAMAMITLLLQPEKLLPDVIILDEPELGLHPSAMSIICALIKQAAHHAQVIIATQSPYLVNHFAPEDIVVVERENDASLFHRLDSESLKDWLEDYSLAELWDKNVFGGRPG